MLHAGIDEAGYGPTLGPLAVVSAVARADDLAALTAAFQQAGTGVRDSKLVHRSGDMAPIERLALAAVSWQTGRRPATAAEVFALLGEVEADRAGTPWMEGADALRLPVAAADVPAWSIPGVEPAGLAGRLVQPAAFNRTIRSGVNKAGLELGCVRGLLERLGQQGACATVVDRLGGRRYYRDFLQEVWPGAEVCADEEASTASRYHVAVANGRQAVSFLVGGEAQSPLTAMASCVAKYARELHLLLLNRYWCARLPGLAPTAGYPEDAKRWLAQIGEADRLRFGPVLVRER
jgi:ribonuclease HII